MGFGAVQIKGHTPVRQPETRADRRFSERSRILVFRSLLSGRHMTINRRPAQRLIARPRERHATTDLGAPWPGEGLGRRDF
jgi:hypothetical protein